MCVMSATTPADEKAMLIQWMVLHRQAPHQATPSHCLHYSDVIMSTMASQTTAFGVFTRPFVQAQIKENIKAPRHWLLWGEFTGHRWIPRTKGQWRGKCFHLMTSSCEATLIKFHDIIWGHGVMISHGRFATKLLLNVYLTQIYSTGNIWLGYLLHNFSVKKYIVGNRRVFLFCYVLFFSINP